MTAAENDEPSRAESKLMSGLEEGERAQASVPPQKGAIIDKLLIQKRVSDKEGDARTSLREGGEGRTSQNHLN